VELLEFLDGWQATGRGSVVVLVDDIKRFARDVSVHFDLKLEIARRGGRLESPGFKFEDSPEGKFIETIIAAQAELERNQNKRQVVNRMKARVEQGFWVFRCPPGYRYERDPVYKKVLAPDPNIAPIVRDALEGYASGELPTPAAVQRFLAGRGFYVGRRGRSASARLTQVLDMLRQVVYAGHVEYAPWGVGLRPGRHPGLISLATFDRIQDRLAGRSVAGALRERQDRSADFVLRGALVCASCGRRITASWTRGARGQRYPYYHCPGRGCPHYGKGVPREKLEAQFVQLLEPLQVTDDLLDRTKVILVGEWEASQARQGEEREQAARRLRQTEASLAALADKLAATSSDVAARVLEQRIEAIEKERALLAEELNGAAAAGERSRYHGEDVGTAFETFRGMLKIPSQSWEHGDYEERRALLTVVFKGSVRYDRIEGFGTADLSLPYQVLATSKNDPSGLVDHGSEIWKQFGETLLGWGLGAGPLI
jgi:DNA invertase Pin-like site-specific DNA recombinase